MANREQLGEAVVSLVSEMRGLRRSLRRAKRIVTRSAAGMARAFRRTMTAAIRGTGRAMAAMARTFRSAISRMARMARTGFMAIQVAAGAALAAGVKEAREFETSMSRIVGLVGVARDQVKSWRPEIERIAAATARGPAELAEAMFFVTSAGLRGSEALDVLEASAKAAAGGLGETKVVADAVTSAVNAYGSEVLSASEATDTLVATVREGKAQPEELAASVGKVLPFASQLDVAFSDVGASIAAMTRTGTDAQTAAIQLRQVLGNFLKPAQQSRDALNELGLTFADLREIAGERGLFEALSALQDAVGEDQEAMARIIPDVRALGAVLDIMGSNADSTQEIFGELRDAAGATEVAVEAARETSTFAVDQAITKVKNRLLDVGERVLPRFAGIIDQLAPAIEALALQAVAVVETLAPALPKVVPMATRLFQTLADAVVAAGPLIDVIASGLGDAIDLLIKGVETAAPMLADLAKMLGPQGVLGGVLGFLLAGPGGAVLGALAGSVGALGEIAATVAPIIQQIGDIFRRDVLPALRPLIPAIADLARIALGTLFDVIRRLAPSVAELFGVLGQVAATVAEALGPAISTLAGALSDVLPELTPLIEAVGRFLVEALQSVAPFLATVVRELLPPLAQAFLDIIEAIRTAGLLDALLELGTELLPVFVELIKGIGQTFKNTDLLTSLTGLVESLTDLLNVLVEEELVPFITFTLVPALEAFAAVVTTVAETISSALDLLPGKDEGGPGFLDVAAPGLGFVTDFLSRQGGGRVPKGRPSIVGESGPELFAPDASGEIVPGPVPMGDGGPSAPTIIVEGSVVTERDIRDVVRREILRFQRVNARTGF